MPTGAKYVTDPQDGQRALSVGFWSAACYQADRRQETELEMTRQ